MHPKLKESLIKAIRVIASVTVMALILIPCSSAANDSITREDYNRAISLMYKNYHNKKLLNAHVAPYWFSDSTGVWFVKHAPNQKTYRKLTFEKYKQSDFFDHEKLAQVITDSLGIKAEANNLPISNTVYKNPNAIEFTIQKNRYTLNVHNYSLTPKLKKERKRQKNNESTSPDEKWVAFAKDFNLHLKSAEKEETKQLSTDGKKNFEYASWYGWDDIMEGENGLRPDHFWVNWSKDSEWIYTSIVDLRSAKKMYLLDHSIDTLYRPKLLSYYRGSPGDTGMVYVEPVFFNVQTGQEIRTGLPRSTHINSIEVKWSEIPGVAYLKYTARGFQKIQIYSFNLNTQHLDTLYTEVSKTNIDNFWYQLSEKNNLIFFLSEKSGWRQLYSLNLQTKEVQAITSGSFYINDIVRVDEANERIYFLASGKEKSQNPYYQKLYSISFKGRNLKPLTPENQHHKVSISPNGQYFMDNYSTINTPTTTVLRSTKSGKILAEIGKANTVELKHWTAPEIFTATARDGKTIIYGALWKPTNFDPTKKYPVIDASYTGPHIKMYPESYASALSLQSFAELGFIMVKIDGLGSPGRSKSFHDYSYKNLGGNLEDHVLAIKQLGKKYSWVDTNRVGIYGHSAGGYDAAHGLLAYPDFYKVGVASSGDHDHRMEKAWWPEMYMGWPVDSAYHLQSNITMAGNLKGKLLLVHGGIDENVNPSATFKLAEALIKADKPFDMLILPSQRHGYSGPYSTYFTKTRWNYFLKNLRGVEPIWEINLE